MKSTSSTSNLASIDAYCVNDARENILQIIKKDLCLSDFSNRECFEIFNTDILPHGVRRFDVSVLVQSGCSNRYGYCLPTITEGGYVEAGDLVCAWSLISISNEAMYSRHVHIGVEMRFYKRIR